MKPAPPTTTLPDWLARHAHAQGAHAALAAAVAACAQKSALEVAPAIEMLGVLEAMAVDDETLAAALIHEFALPEVEPRAPSLKALVDGQVEAERVWKLHRERAPGSGAEGLRRLLLAVIRDLRVVFILLARHLSRMRAMTSKGSEAQRHAMAELAADIHAPLANRLGIWQVKWELEDLAFRFLKPDIYKRIAKLLDERRGDRERFISTAMHVLKQSLAAAGIEADVAGRPKHIYSIWKKMQRKQSDFEHLYDIRALRVLVRDVPTCYAALGVVHTLWPHIPGEFDDYIARPKGNDYQSLHTAVVGPEGKTLEVQIRTHDMHAHAELGVAAHWRYKEGGSGDAAFERKIARMRQLLETRGEREEDGAFASDAPSVVDDRVYLLTPQGKVIDLQKGATVLDFAYHVHTEVGHRCRGAKVNGRIVPITYAPASGDTVEILTGKVAEPRRDWIVAGAGFLNSARAKEKVRAWFRHADHERNVAEGREILDREVKRLALSAKALETLLPRFEFKTLDELFVAVGIGEVTASQVARALHEIDAPKPAGRPLQSAEPPKQRRAQRDAVVIQGVGNLMHVIARCCQPLPGDPVAGFLTRGKGVSIHRKDCPSLQQLASRDPARVVPVEWGSRDAAHYEVNIVVHGYDRKGLLKDVSGAISNADIDVLAASTRTDPDEGTAEMHFALRVRDFGQLSGLLSRILALPNVLDARRVTGGAGR